MVDQKDYDYREAVGYVPRTALSVRARRRTRKGPLPPVERLRELFDYNDVFGLFRKSHNQYVSQSALTVSVDGKYYQKHRIISMLLLGTDNGIHPYFAEAKQREREEAERKREAKRLAREFQRELERRRRVARTDFVQKAEQRIAAIPDVNDVADKFLEQYQGKQDDGQERDEELESQFRGKDFSGEPKSFGLQELAGIRTGAEGRGSPADAGHYEGGALPRTYREPVALKFGSSDFVAALLRPPADDC